jgi:hypothetical protein
VLQSSGRISLVRSDETDRPALAFTQIGERLLFSSTKVSYGCRLRPSRASKKVSAAYRLRARVDGSGCSPPQPYPWRTWPPQ